MVFDNINKKDVLSELPSLRDFTKTKIDEIYENAVKLLHIKYNVEIIQDNPFVFKDNRQWEKYVHQLLKNIQNKLYLY